MLHATTLSRTMTMPHVDPLFGPCPWCSSEGRTHTSHIRPPSVVVLSGLALLPTWLHLNGAGHGRAPRSHATVSRPSSGSHRSKPTAPVLGAAAPGAAAPSGGETRTLFCARSAGPTPSLLARTVPLPRGRVERGDSGAGLLNRAESPRRCRSPPVRGSGLGRVLW